MWDLTSQATYHVTRCFGGSGKRQVGFGTVSAVLPARCSLASSVPTVKPNVRLGTLVRCGIFRPDHPGWKDLDLGKHRCIRVALRCSRVLEVDIHCAQ